MCTRVTNANNLTLLSLFCSLRSECWTTSFVLTKQMNKCVVVNGLQGHRLIYSVKTSLSLSLFISAQPILLIADLKSLWDVKQGITFASGISVWCRSRKCCGFEPFFVCRCRLGSHLVSSYKPFQTLGRSTWGLTFPKNWWWFLFFNTVIPVA